MIATGFESSNLPGTLLSRSTRREPLQRDNENKEAFQPRSLNTEDLDIPTFLRNRVRS